MKLWLRCAGMLLGVWAAGAGRAETWTTTSGEAVEGKLTAVYGPLAWISGKESARFVAINELDEAALERVADYLATQRATPVWKESNSKIGKALRGRLQVLNGDKLATFDPGARAEPEFYLAYFGAHWCGPCRRFSPRLVAAYEQLKKRAGDRVEVIYVSSDRSSDEMLKYVREAKMPWPLIKFSAVGSVSVIERWAGRGIPCLVVLSREGELLFHSYRGEEYLGPDDPLGKVEGLLRLSDPRNPESRRGLHRLAVLQHRRAAQGGERRMEPYLVNLNLARYQTLEFDRFTAHVEVDESGKVLNASTSPELPTALKFQFEKDAAAWLFLPMIRGGATQPAKADVPIVVQK